MPFRPTTPPDLLKPLVGWAVVLGFVSSQVAQGHCHGVDQWIAGWVASLRAPNLDAAAAFVTFFGSSLWAAVALTVLSVLTWRKQRLAAVGILWGAFGLCVALEGILRITVAHWRPDAATLPASMSLSMKFHLAGFPSGHGIRSAFVFGWLLRLLKGRTAVWTHIARGICVAMIGLVGLTRLYLNRHWAADIVGSWLVVLVVVAIARCWERAWQERP